MTDEPTWYDVLGVAPTSSPDDIRAAHRLASKASHPDAGGSAAGFQLVQQAYEVLSDPERRAAYDRERRGEPTARPTDRTARTPVPPPHAAAAPAARHEPGGCLTPWIAVGAGIVLVVAVLVTIATLSSSSGPGSSATGLASAPTTTRSAPGAVTTVVLSDPPPDFPRGHVPLPASARLAQVVVASAGSEVPTYTIVASGPGTDPDRAALNYATTLQAVGWSAAPDVDPGDGADGTRTRSLTDRDGSQLQFSVVPADSGGLQYLIGFHPARR